MFEKIGVILLFGLVLHLCNASSDPVITTQLGEIKGVTRSVEEGTVLQFFRIPFAQPPVGPLRFKKPAPLTSRWEGELDATRVGPSCYQTKKLYGIDKLFPLLPNKDISEDCLHLNIYVPNSIATARPKAVMIYIHGGGFILGQSFCYDATRLALRGDVIVVTINYRVGPFGFLSTGDAASPGNYGLWDQRLAIQWTKDNIAAFGGDPSSITIFGQSAGGMSVGLQSISPVNKGLFQRGIAHSGTAFSTGMAVLTRKTDNMFMTHGIAKELDCLETSSLNSPDTNAIITCLQSKSASDIQKAADPLLIELSDKFILPIPPVVDNDFIPDFPEILLMDSTSKSNEVFSDIDFMSGSTDDDGAWFANFLDGPEDMFKFNVTQGIPNQVLCENIAPTVGIYFFDSKQISTALCNYYTAPSGVDGKNIEQGQKVLDMLGDIGFHAPAVRQLELHAKTTHSSRATFHYLFSQRPDYPAFDTLKKPAWIKGANHGDDVAFVFGLKDFYKRDLTFIKKELKLADQVMDYWANFAKHGTPNGPGLPRWPQYDVTTKQYMDIQTDSSVKSDLFSERMKFVLQDLPGIVSKEKQKTRTEL